MLKSSHVAAVAALLSGAAASRPVDNIEHIIIFMQENRCLCRVPSLYAAALLARV